jgi:RNA polymerase sigma-70 factor (ECF subfamily)
VGFSSECFVKKDPPDEPTERPKFDEAKFEEDRRLMELVAQGQDQAQRVVAQRLMSRATRLCGAMLRQSNDVEDAAQAGMLEVLRAAKTYRGDAPLEAWADRIVAHAALRIARDRKRHAVAEEVDIAVDPPTRDDEDVLGQLERLPESCRDAVVLRHVVEMSIPEIAAMTEVSENTVKDRLLRGREMLRKHLRRNRNLGPS